MTRKSDVAIIGAGLAGLQCALTLSELRPDLRIRLCDQTMIGGSARWAVGSFTAAGTKWQSYTGVQDTTAEHYADLLRMCEFDGGEQDVVRYRVLLRQMCDAGPAQLDELERRGVVFSGPCPEPPHQRARMHNAVPNASAVTRALSECLMDRRNVTVDTDRAIVDLAPLSRNGYRLTSPSDELEVEAVVVASGDCSATHPTVPSVNPGAQGKPIALASFRLGARRHEPLFLPGLRAVSARKPCVAPTDSIVSASQVRYGEKRVDGSAFLECPETFVGEELYLELRPSDIPTDTYICTYPGIAYARIQDLETDGLATMTSTEKGLQKLTIGPFRVLITLADGALDVDAAMRVLDVDNRPIDALWACGSAALGGIRLGGHGHHLLWAAVTGSLAAKSMADVL